MQGRTYFEKKEPRRILANKPKICFFCFETVGTNGRLCKSKWVAHHINGDFTDNREENLAWAHNGCHISKHRTDRKVTQKEIDAFVKRMIQFQRRRKIGIWTVHLSRNWRIFWRKIEHKSNKERSRLWRQKHPGRSYELLYLWRQRQIKPAKKRKKMSSEEKVVRHRVSNKLWKQNNPQLVCEQKRRAYQRNHPKKRRLYFSAAFPRQQFTPTKKN